ncbi:hypothetical protein PIROE2DRAFT_13789, partial [Piromyces sp. E2]
PQQKRQKRKYKKHNKDNSKIIDVNSFGENSSLVNNLFIKDIKEIKDFNITPDIYNNLYAYTKSKLLPDKVVNDNIPIVNSDSINYLIINYYYKYFHPLYPIVNYNSFILNAKNGTLTKHLLYAIYGMAYFMKDDSEYSKSIEYINKAKSLVNQNYNIVNVQLLQTLCLLSIYGNDSSWFYTKLGVRIVTNNSFLLDSNNKSSFSKEDIKEMKNLTLLILGYDTWINLSYKKLAYPQELNSFITHNSDLLSKVTINALSLEYEFHISCINIIILEIVHLELKMKSNEFNIKDIDCINTDILRIQHYYIGQKDDIPFVLFNDIADDFSYYLESSEILEEKNEHNNNNNNNNHGNTINNDVNNNINDDRVVILNVVKGISKDENFFKINHHFLSNKKVNKRYSNRVSKSSFEVMKIIFETSKDFEEKRKLVRFLLITVGEKIYLNLSLIFYVFKNPIKTENYPIAKSIATVSKGADDCSICLKFLLELSEQNNVSLRFRYIKAWVFYQYSIVYIFRYVATQEKKFTNNDSKYSNYYSVFSSFPQETLAPCYFYLDLLKDMKRYFVNVSTYIKEIKLLIYEAKKSVQEKTFRIHIPDLLL